MADLHTDYASTAEDPCQHVRHLGQGAFGVVDAVTLKNDASGKVYARKFARLGPHQREQLSRLFQEEAGTIRALKHRHIIEVHATYTWRSHFGMIMSPVADTDLKEFLERIDSTSDADEAQLMMTHLQGWPVCLITALDFLHEMRAKHRDIKPANILIKDNKILLADFGLSRIVPTDATTKSIDTFGGTALYLAPEAAEAGQRHGRAADMYALVCVLLEIANALIYSPGSGKRKDYFQLRLHHNARGKHPNDALAMWIKELWLNRKDRYETLGAASLPISARTGLWISELAFLALDPNPGSRITPRQSLALVAQSTHLSDVACEHCQKVAAGQHLQTVTHSRFMPMNFYGTPLRYNIERVALAGDWEALKRACLKEHMWWPPLAGPSSLQRAWSSITTILAPSLRAEEQHRSPVPKGYQPVERDQTLAEERAVHALPLGKPQYSFYGDPRNPDPDAIRMHQGDPRPPVD